MDDIRLLQEEFLSQGRKQGLDDSFLIQILDYLMDNQFVPAGERESIRNQLFKMIREHAKGD
jgi:hypothetical protein